MIVPEQKGRGMETEQIFATLEAELAAFTQQRSPAYLRQALADGCYIYGVGGYGRRILALLQAQGIVCHGVVDRKFTSTGEEIDGVPALPLAGLSVAQAAGRSLVVGVHNHLADLGEILSFGTQTGFREILWNADLPDLLGAEADNYWLTNRAFTLAHFAELHGAAALLRDQLSIETLVALLRYRVTGSVAAHPVSDLMQQYTVPGLLHFAAPITFVDGGAYNGDTYSHLLAAGINISNWLAFEPDPENYKALTAFAATLNVQSILFPCGLSENFMQVQFAASGGTSSHLTAHGGGMTVPCVALDEVVHGPAPDYIKLDIEGAERSALLGMRKTIATAKPHLAISAYHRPEDLWVLAQTMAELAPYADLYLRQHCANAFETVLYAVPRELAR